MNEVPRSKKTGHAKRTLAYITAVIFIILAAVYWIQPDIYKRSSQMLSQYFNAASDNHTQPNASNKIPEKADHLLDDPEP